MAGDLHIRKREKIFSKLDTDRDGVIKEADIKDHIGGFLTKFSVPPNSPEAQKLHEAGGRLWQELKLQDGDGDGAITKDEYVRSVDNDRVEQLYITMNESFFAVIDSNGDGLITENELVEALKPAGMTAKDVHNAFQKLDADHDGKISRDEWDQVTDEILTSSDPAAPGSLLMGMR
jgi:Ca2+-binding EF-hand superfamily protein